MDEILRILSSGALGIVAVLVVSLVRVILERLVSQRHEKPVKSYSERLTELTASLAKATKEVDGILVELSTVAKEREATVSTLQVDLARLQKQEKELKEQVELLQKTPVPVAEHFAKLVASGERRSARRDYILFGAGVLVTTVIAIVIQLWTR